MKVETYPEDLYAEMMEFKPLYVIVTLGGNDINSKSNPLRIYHQLVELSDRLISSGVIRTFFTSICPRGRFIKDFMLTKPLFDCQRQIINQKLHDDPEVGTVFVRVKLNRHYTHDLVHLNDEGNRAYFYSIRCLMASLK